MYTRVHSMSEHGGLVSGKLALVTGAVAAKFGRLDAAFVGAMARVAGIHVNAVNPPSSTRNRPRCGQRGRAGVQRDSEARSHRPRGPYCGTVY